MAARYGRAQVSGVATTTSTRTLLQLLANNVAIRITEISIGFHGVNNTHIPITVQLLRQSTAGTMSALTPVKADDSIADALNTTAQHSATGAEPTPGDILATIPVHPQTSMVVPITEMAPIIVGAGDRLGLRVLAQANSVNLDACICFEE